MPNPLHDSLFAPLGLRDDAFLILPDGNEISGKAFMQRVSRLANTLRAEGVAPGDRVLVQLAKSPDALAIYAAAVTLGAVFLPLNPAYTAAEAGYFLTDAAPRVVVADPGAAPALEPLAREAGARLFTLDAKGGGTLAEAAANQPDRIKPADRTDEDLAALLYTSGTTGRSKGAMLTQRNLLSNARALVDLWQFTSTDVLLNALPVFHTHGLFVATNVTLMAGGKMLFLPAFDADEILRMMPQATTMMGVPTFYTRLLDHPGLTREAVAHMRLFISGSAPLLEETHIAFQERTGHSILERYGMTETNMNTSNPVDGPRRPGTVGKPLPGVEVRITDTASGKPLPPGETGMVEVRGPNVFKGYWNMPEKTAEELRPNGFFITGDLGRYEPDGYLQIVGRQKDLIISGGLNVYPREVEMAIDDLPDVQESAVVGVPHPDFGEAVFAVVVPQPGKTVDAERISAQLRDGLARFKQPKAVVVVDSLPRNTMGKVQKAALRSEYGAWFSA
jgi:malonyl-CoA/methylmalonyl-CoA synthetase